MFTVTPDAASKIKDYLNSNKLEDPVRVVLQNGCGGMSLGLALDSTKDGDQVFREQDITFLVESGIMATTGAIKVDFVPPSSDCGCSGGGFTVTSEKPLAGGGCGSSCASGSCG